MNATLEMTRERSGPVLHRRLSYVFGTLVELVIADAKETAASEAAAAVFGEFDRLHWKLHAWKPGELVDLNRAIAAGQAGIRIDREIAALIRDAAAPSVRSEGLFNPAIGRLVALWHFHDDVCRPARPDATEIARLVQADPRMSDLVVRDGELFCANASVQIDFGGYAKGYALDRARELLRERDIAHALVNVGGHLMALGQRGDRPWSIAMRRPRDPGVFAGLDLRDGEVVSTSGDYERYFTIDGKRYAHIIDPRTGFPADRVQAVSVLVSSGPRSGAFSDAASSALFVAGPCAWRAAARRLGVTHALLVDGDGKIHVSAALQGRLALFDEIEASVC